MPLHVAFGNHPTHIGRWSLASELEQSMREHIRRSGQYVLDMDRLPGPLNPQPLPFEVAL